MHVLLWNISQMNGCKVWLNTEDENIMEILIGSGGKQPPPPYLLFLCHKSVQDHYNHFPRSQSNTKLKVNMNENLT